MLWVKKSTLSFARILKLSRKRWSCLSEPIGSLPRQKYWYRTPDDKRPESEEDRSSNASLIYLFRHSCPVGIGWSRPSCSKVYLQMWRYRTPGDKQPECEEDRSSNASFIYLFRHSCPVVAGSSRPRPSCSKGHLQVWKSGPIKLEIHLSNSLISSLFCPRQYSWKVSTLVISINEWFGLKAEVRSSTPESSAKVKLFIHQTPRADALMSIHYIAAAIACSLQTDSK